MSGLLRNRYVLYVLSALTFVGGWWVAALVAATAGYANMLPTPVLVAAAVVKLAEAGDIQRHLFLTLWRVFAGFAIAEVLGIIIGTAMGLKPWFEIVAE